MRFHENMNLIDHQQLNYQSRDRKDRLDHIQQLLFDNLKQQDKQITDTQIVREPRVDSALIYSQQDGVSRLKMPGDLLYNREKMPFVF